VTAADGTTFRWPSHWPPHETVHSPDCERCHLEATWVEDHQFCRCVDQPWEREDLGTPAVPDWQWVCTTCLRIEGPSWAGAT